MMTGTVLPSSGWRWDNSALAAPQQARNNARSLQSRSEREAHGHFGFLQFLQFLQFKHTSISQITYTYAASLTMPSCISDLSLTRTTV